MEAHRHGFPDWLIANFALAALALLAGGGWFYHTQEQQARQTVATDLQAIAKSKAGQIVQWRTERLADGAAAKKDRSLIEGVMAVLGREVAFQGMDYRGVEVLSAIEAISDSPWFLVVKEDKAEALEGWRSRSALILASILGLFLATAAAVMAWQQRAKAHYRALFQAELAHRETATRNSVTLRSIGDGVIVVDAEGRVDLLNPVAEQLTGWPHAEAHGRPLEEVFRIANEHTRQPAENPVPRVLREGIIKGLANHTVLIARGGAERPIADSSAPIRNGQGGICGAVLVFRDQTEERAAQKALAASEERFRAIFDNAPVGITEVEVSTGRFVRVNRRYCEIVGLSPEQMTASTFMAITHPDDLQANLDSLEQLRQGATESFTMEKRYLRPDGSAVWVNLGVSVMRTPGESPRFFIAVVEDITARREAESNRQLAAKVLWQLNRSSDPHVLIRETIRLIKEWGGFDAVGLRFRDGEDFPYYEQNGFSDAFVREENYLCDRDTEGRIVHDVAGRPVLQCTCGLVLAAGTDPGKPYFTRGGSFWTNTASELLSLTPEDDPRTKPRNRCIHNGYESVALVPLRSDDEIVGLLQMNSRRGERFTPELIRFFENLAVSMSIALKRGQAEAALGASEAKYRSLFEKMAEGAIYYDAEGRFLSANGAAGQILGLPLDQIRGRTPLDPRWQIVREDGSPFPGETDPVMTTLRTGREVREVFGIYNPQLESRRWIIVHAVPEFVPGQERPCGGFVTFEDITERKEIDDKLVEAKNELEARVEARTAALAARTEELERETIQRQAVIQELTVAEREMEREFAFRQTIIERASEGLCVCHEAAEFPFIHFTIWNDRMTEITGYTIEEINRRGWYQTVYLDAESAERSRQRLAERFAGRDSRSEESIITRADGTQRTLLISGKLLPGVEGPPQVLATITDISGQREAEESLRKSEIWYCSLIALGATVYSVVDAAGQIVFVSGSTQRITGREGPEYRGRNVFQYIHPEDLPRMREHFAALAADPGNVHEATGRFQHVDGSWRVVAFQGVNLLNDPMVKGIIITAHDVTERDRAERRLQQSMRAQFEAEKLATTGRLAARVAHEINNPLAGIKNAFRIFQRVIPRDCPEFAYVARTEAELERVVRIVRQMYELHRPEQGKTVEIRLDHECREVGSILEPILRQQDLTLDLREPLPEVRVRLPEGAVRQILMNLVSNAMDASPEGGTVTIGLTAADDRATISVTDRGDGMCEQVRARIFEPFFTTKAGVEMAGGLGLGLSISKQIAESFGGALECESTLGEGCVFRLMIPLRLWTTE